MQPTKIILFNGPPRSGKDTAATMAMLAAERFGNVWFYRFAEPLKDAVHALFGMPGIMIEHFDGLKDVKLGQMFGMSPREAYIWLSEECVKPKFGKEFFAHIAVNRIKSEAEKGGGTVVISDCGFQSEVDVLIEAFGADSVSVVHMYRYDCDFKNDSRGYITHPNTKERIFGVWNSGTKEDLQKEITELVGSIISGKARE